jgi:hypothetical protein
MNAQSHTARSHRLSIALLAFVFMVYGVLGFLLYRGRWVSHSSFFESDLIIFTVPFLSAIIANAYILFSSGWLRPRSAARRVGLLLVGFILAFLSFWAYMVCALNTYGE